MPAESTYVLDACAVLALLQREPGAEVVAGLLETRENFCLMHAINACEVYYDIYRRDGEEDAANLVEILTDSGIELVEELSTELWQSAGKLKAEWRRVSLADCLALALTIQREATLVTSDRHELARVVEAGVCPALFIR